ncbi:MAG: hypothetical protein JJU02_02960 [Cryomorphaceae bacterium]|nr:hypothetical protein [Cryomorphaceae bacterium]
MKEHEAFDKWLRQQVNNSPVPDSEAYWQHTATKIPASGSRFVKWLGGMSAVSVLLVTIWFLQNDQNDTVSHTNNPEVQNQNFTSDLAQDNENNIADYIESQNIVYANSQVDTDEPVISSTSNSISKPVDVNSVTNSGNSLNSAVVSNNDALRSETNTSGEIPDVESEPGIHNLLAQGENSTSTETTENPTTVNPANNSENNPDVLLAAGMESASMIDSKEEAVQDQDENLQNEAQNTTLDSSVDESDGEDVAAQDLLAESDEKLRVDLAPEEDEIGETAKKLSSQPRISAFTSLNVGGVINNLKSSYGFHSLEFGLEYSFSKSWGISLAGNASMLQGLNHSVHFVRIDYDFDQIIQTAEMSYREVFYLQTPLRLHFRKNRHTFALGVVPTFVMSGRSHYKDFGESDFGPLRWGYTDGLRTFHLLGAVEYDFSINKNWQIGALYHHGTQNLLEETNTPRFQYIQLRIRRWW